MMANAYQSTISPVPPSTTTKTIAYSYRHTHTHNGSEREKKEKEIHKEKKRQPNGNAHDDHDRAGSIQYPSTKYFLVTYLLGINCFLLTWNRIHQYTKSVLTFCLVLTCSALDHGDGKARQKKATRYRIKSNKGIPSIRANGRAHAHALSLNRNHAEKWANIETLRSINDSNNNNQMNRIGIVELLCERIISVY